MTVPTLCPSRFGLFEFDPLGGELFRRGLRVHLAPQVRGLLALLLEPPIRMHTREEIRRRLWPENTYVDFERGVNKVVCSLRSALGESARNPRFIETVEAEGYRFLSSVLEPVPTDAPARVADGVERLAVLPMRTEPEAEIISLSRIITTLLRERLAVMPGIRVMAESTVKCHKIKKLNPQQLGECLGVQAIVAGEVSRQNGQLMLELELIDAADGALRCGFLLERAWPAAARCERDIVHEALRHIRPFLSSPAVPKMSSHQAGPPALAERAS